MGGGQHAPPTQTREKAKSFQKITKKVKNFTRRLAIYIQKNPSASRSGRNQNRPPGATPLLKTTNLASGVVSVGKNIAPQGRFFFSGLAFSYGKTQNWGGALDRCMSATQKKSPTPHPKTKNTTPENLLDSRGKQHGSNNEVNRPLDWAQSLHPTCRRNCLQGMSGLACGGVLEYDSGRCCHPGKPGCRNMVGLCVVIHSHPAALRYLGGVAFYLLLNKNRGDFIFHGAMFLKPEFFA